MDIRNLLDYPAVKQVFGAVMGGRATQRVFVREILRPEAGQRVLDIGCGTANVLAQFPEVEYVGFDLSERYIEAAHQRHGNRGTFHVRGIDRKLTEELNLHGFDLVFAKGVLHHLDDETAHALLDIATSAMKPDGRFVSFDVCYAEGQSAASRFLASLDRGRHVRPVEQFVTLAKFHFSGVTHHVRHNLHRFPSTRLIMECTDG